MSAPRWPVVVFDLDGTVVNTIPLIIASYGHALEAVLGERPTDEEARSWIGQTLPSTFGRLYPEHAEALVDAYLSWNAEHLEELVQDFPGIPELLDSLGSAGVATGMATSKRRASAERTLALAGLAERLPVTVAMEDTAAHKPSPDPLFLALSRIGREPGEAAYVGDAVVDVRAAKAAGMAAIAVSWGAADRDALVSAGPDVVVDTISELRACLLG